MSLSHVSRLPRYCVNDLLHTCLYSPHSPLWKKDDVDQAKSLPRMETLQEGASPAPPPSGPGVVSAPPDAVVSSARLWLEEAHQELKLREGAFAEQALSRKTSVSAVKGSSCPC